MAPENGHGISAERLDPGQSNRDPATFRAAHNSKAQYERNETLWTLRRRPRQESTGNPATIRRYLLVLKKLKPGSANFVEANRRRTRLIGKASIGQTALQIGTFDNYRFSKQTSWRTDVQRVFERILFRTASGLMTKILLGDWGQRGLYLARRRRPPQEESRRTTKMARSETGNELLICDTALLERRQPERKAF